MNKANILIGLGGTGAKILCELAELLSQDARWVADSDTDLFFLLLDTDGGDLEKSQRRIQDALPHVYCHAQPLARDLASLSPLLGPWHDKFQALKSHDPEAHDKGIARFAEHWWFPKPEEPTFDPIAAFSAHRVQNIHTGAGQVPAVSHFCAWSRMTDISEAYQKLFNAVTNRRASLVGRGENAIQESNVFFLGSFAGGTGRGALIPSAFRFKQDFYQRFQRTISPSLYVFDASCFEKILKKSELNSVRMNALSGFSELSAWERLHVNADEQVPYFLPSPVNPADPEHDVVGFTRVSKELLRQFIRPFDAVSITCRQAENLEASSPDQLYSMLAGALYVRMSQSSIASGATNEGRSLLSIGSASCRVDVQSIKDYYRQRARYDALFRLQAPTDIATRRDQAEDLADEILERRVGVAQAAHSLLAKEPLLEKSKARNIFEMFTCVLFQQDSFGGIALAALNDALNKQDLDLVEETVADRFDSNRKLGDGDFSKEVSAIFNRAVSEFARLHGSGEFNDCHSWTRTLADDITSCEKRERLSVFARTGSAALAGTVAGVMLERLSSFATHDLSRMELMKLIGDTDPDLPGVVAKVQGRSFVMFGERFDPKEIAEVMETARQTLMLMVAQALGLVLKNDDGPFAGLRATLKRIETNARCLADASAFLIQDINPDELEKARKECFVTRNENGRVKWQDLTNSLLDFDSDQRFVKRIIKPLEPTEKDGLRLTVGEFGPVISEILSGPEIPPENRRAVSNPELTGRIKETLARQVRYVAQSDDAAVQQDVATLVQFGPSIRRLWNAWTEELNHHLQDPDFEPLRQRFQNFFGVEPVITPNRDAVRVDGQFNGVSAQDSPILAMAISLARTCQTFWRLKAAQAAADPHVILMVPVDVADTELAAWTTHLNAEIGGRVDLVRNKTITLPNGNRVSYNPFILSAYCADGTTNFDNIESLSYWSTQPQLKDLMRRIDRTDWVPAQFATNEADDAPPEYRTLYPGYRGSGFADPCYLFNSTLRNARWRPWVEKGERMADAAQDNLGRISLVSLYAVWGPEAFLGEAKDKGLTFMGNCRWPTNSILETKDKERLALRRFPGLLGSSNPPRFQATLDGIDYTVGGIVEQSLGNLANVFNGTKKDSRYGTAKSGPALFAAATREFDDFCEEVGDHCGFHPNKNSQAFASLMSQLAERIMSYISDNAPAEDDKAVLVAAHGAALAFSKTA